MEQRDFLMRQIELMMHAIVALIRKLTGLKDLKEDEMQQITDDMLFQHLEVSVAEIIKTPREVFTELITSMPGMNENNLELFSDVLVLNSKSRNSKTEALDLLKKAFAILNWIDDKSSTFSMDRQDRIKEIQSMIGEAE